MGQRHIGGEHADAGCGPGVDDPYLARAAEMLEDASQALDLATVMALPDREWVPVQADVLPISYSRSAWWVRLQFTNSGDQME